jgi:hypothetical protein
LRYLALPILALALIGCGSPSPAPDPISAQATASAPQQIAPPDFGNLTKLGIVKRSGTVRVGMSYEDAVTIFAEPPGSYEKSDLPPAIPPTYEARGWHNKDEGFGTILYKGRVAAAVSQLERANEDRLDEILALQRDAYGPSGKTVAGKYVRYWFWQGPDWGNQSLMVCATEAKPKKLSITLATGTGQIMEALRMAPDAATRDQARADRLFDQQKTGSKTNSSNSPNRAGS